MRRKSLLLVLVVGLAACSSGTAPTSVAPAALPRGWNGTAKYVSHSVGRGAEATLTVEATGMRWREDPLVAPLGDGTTY